MTLALYICIARIAAICGIAISSLVWGFAAAVLTHQFINDEELTVPFIQMKLDGFNTIFYLTVSIFVFPFLACLIGMIWPIIPISLIVFVFFRTLFAIRRVIRLEKKLDKMEKET